MLEADVKVTRQTEQPEYAQDGSRQSFIRVEFFVGKHGPFTEKFPKDSYSAIVRDTRLTELAREYRV